MRTANFLRPPDVEGMWNMDVKATRDEWNSAPLEVSVLEPTDPWLARCEQIAWAFVALGIVLRLVRFLLRFPLWGDEYMLGENLLDRGYVDLMRPLDYGQVAPVGFLWLVRASTQMFGFNEWSLRLFPLLSSVASLFLFRHLAGRVLRGVPFLLAVGIFCATYYPIRHAAELKPYASDLAISVLMLTLAIEAWQNPTKSRWLWAMAGIMPLALGISFPAVFVAGGISVGLLAPQWKSGSRASRIAYMFYNVALVGSFGLVMALAIQNHYDASKKIMTNYWAGAFPPALNAPGRLIAWLAETHTGEMFAYPFGADNGGSILTSICVAVAAWMLYRQQRKSLLCMFAGVFVLAFLAAAVHRYPYGGNSRLVQYLAPIICLLAGLGLAIILAKSPQIAWRRRALACYLATLVVMGGGVMVYDLVHPFKHRVDVVHQGFARWFWGQNWSDSKVVCLKTDWQKDIFTTSDFSGYLCYQRIYSPRHQRGARSEEEIGLDTTRPLRCVVYSTQGEHLKAPAFTNWLAEMEAQYDLVERQTHKVQLNIPRELDVFGYYEVYSFRPKSEPRASGLVRKIETVDEAKANSKK
jgi:hypothetical protein